MAKVVSFRCEYGTSVEIRGQWHKFSCAIEVQPEEDEDTSDMKEKAWNTVYNEIEKQVRDIT